MKAHEKSAVKKMAAEVKAHLEKSNNISISVLNYGLELTKPVIKALRAEGLTIDEQELKYSFMGYVKFVKPEAAKV
jgi:hypothetical protein